ncbi:Uncharacterised protein [Yersinia intermedia]|uniref:hypothetical protein n=1 Tax=Yersinia intermedia TaxID=631 RepID=UPI0005E35233|nr:hypothetical protein [Yersinia intermedia]MDA5512668.1 hypothetical protein [Yersinia intermedia]CNH51118.1 Uncharacterised protein [Yersinia intermedia]CQD77495.1 Uncharacterised protein [Yersinia intermedia]
MNSIRSSLSSVLTSCRWILVLRISVGLTVALSAFALQTASGAVGDNPIIIPDTHHQTSQRSVTLDGQPASLSRYERRDERNAFLEGEHFSTVIAADGTLKGFANISLDLVGKSLPSRERAEQIATEFLRKTAPDLLTSLGRASVTLHNEPIRLSHAGRNETIQLTGLKFKARNLADGRWFWVIIGSDEKPMLFERDLEWATLLARRKTEQWLHDRWIKAQDAQQISKPSRWSLPWTH